MSTPNPQRTCHVLCVPHLALGVAQVKAARKPAPCCSAQGTRAQVLQPLGATTRQVQLSGRGMPDAPTCSRELGRAVECKKDREPPRKTRARMLRSGGHEVQDQGG